MVLENANMVERAFDQRFRARLAIFLEQVFLKAAGIDADADRAAVGLGRADHFLDPLFGPDVARIDAQAGGAGVGRFERSLVVEMDVGDDRNTGRTDDFLERGSRFHVRA